MSESDLEDRGFTHVIGVDVSKAKLHCLLLLGPDYEKIRQKSVANDPYGFEVMLEWACRQARCAIGELHIVMEAAGVYHEGAALVETPLKRTGRNDAIRRWSAASRCGSPDRNHSRGHATTQAASGSRYLRPPPGCAGNVRR